MQTVNPSVAVSSIHLNRAEIELNLLLSTKLPAPARDNPIELRKIIRFPSRKLNMILRYHLVSARST